MKMTQTEDHTTFDFEATGNRRCGGCTLCCKLLPMRSLMKPSNTRCKHQRSGKGCAIYERRPWECQMWSCRWLAAEDETSGMPRPDRAHYVIDMMLDEAQFVDNATGKVNKFSVLQIWVDPAFPEAKDEPHLRAYMLRMAQQHGLPSLLRWSSRVATAVFPPPLGGDEWHERTSGCNEAIGIFGRLPPELRPPE